MLKRHLKQLAAVFENALQEFMFSPEESRIEKKFKSRELQFQTITENSADAIFVIDQTGSYVYANRAATDLFGYSAEELMKKKITDLAPENQTEKYFEFLNQLLTKGKVYTELIFLRKDGTSVPVELNTVVLPDGLLVGSCRDISERKKSDEDLRRMATVVSDSNDAVILHDLDGKILAWNRGAKETYGYTEAEALQMNVRDIVAESDRGAAEDLIQKVKLGDIVKSFELKRITKDGRTIDVWLTKTLLTDENGNPVAIATTERDITERKLAETALKDKVKDLHRMATVVSDSNDAVIMHDLEGKILAWNRGAKLTYGYTEAEALGKNVRDIVAESDREAALNLIERIKNGEIVKSFELRRVAKDGRILDVWLTTTLLSDEKGNPVAIATTERDITERKQAEADRIAKEAAESANHMKSEFLANMSHEIRTPMNAILGYAELLGFLIEEKNQKNYLESIKSSGRGLLILINDILDLSRIEAGKTELHFEFVDTRFFFSEFTQIFSLKVEEKGLEIILDISSGIPAGIYVDEAKLRQVLFNLIGNALKFTEKGYVKLKVFVENPQILTINQDKTEEFIDLVIEVEDTGIGISKEFQEEIFKPFVQQQGQSTKKYGGTGLGLAITLRLVNLMNGTIHLQSEPNKGSTFRVKIPDVAYLRNFETNKVEITINPLEIIFEKAVILVADDIGHNRSYLKDALSNSNLIIIEAENGLEAYNKAKENPPDLIITDIRMPVMDGFQLLEKLKADEFLKHIPVIAYSASVMKAQKERILESKFAGLLMKPVQVTELYHELIHFLHYKNYDEKELVQVETETAEIRKIQNISGLVNSLETQYKDVWKTFELRQPINEISDFGNHLIVLGKKHNAAIITAYGNDLLIASDCFDVENILKLIKKYPAIIKKIHTVSNK
jgi:two-component system sensor histidine kinase EvgS